MEFFVAKDCRFWYNECVMEKKIRFYVSPKNWLTWLVALCMAGSAVTRVLFVGVEGTDVWCQIVLPIVAAVLYGIICLASGKERFYKTAIPVWMMAIYSGIWIRNNIDGQMMVWLFWIALIFFASTYTQIISGKLAGMLWLLGLIILSPMGFLAYFYRTELMNRNWQGLLPAVSDVLALLGSLTGK